METKLTETGIIQLDVHTVNVSVLGVDNLVFELKIEWFNVYK